MTAQAVGAGVLEQLRLIVGADHVLTSELDTFGYSYDSSFVPLLPPHRPLLVVRPRTTEQVSAVMALAHDHELPVTPRGAASGRTGGSVPLQGGIALALDRMTEILEVDEANMMVTVEPGVRTMDLHDACAARGLFYPPDPGSWKYCTIGGNVAENAGGMRAVKYGVTGDYVMGLRVVLADGSVLDTGGKAIKNVTGYDLTSLFTGSEGTLGVVTRVLLRLIPLPKRRGVMRILFATMDAGCATVPRSAFPEVVRRIAAIAAKYDLLIPVFGHAGDGNLHPSVLCDLADADQAVRVHHAVDEIFAAALAVGGTLTGEHGIGITKRPYLAQAIGAAGVRTLQAIKQSLDPKGILNPGKIW